MSDARLSVILATDRYETIRGVISALRRQRDPALLEIVIAMPPSEHGGVREDELRPFAGTVLVAVDSVTSLARCRQGPRDPRRVGAVCVPGRDPLVSAAWLERRDPRGVRGPMGRGRAGRRQRKPCPAGQPGSRTSSTTPCGGRTGPSGVLSDPLVYNAAYRRDVERGLGDRLEVGARSLRGRALAHPARPGAPGLVRVGRAAAPPERGDVSLAVRRTFRLFGATLGARRAARWSWPRRAVYVLASPVIPWVMFVRVLRATWKADSARACARHRSRAARERRGEGGRRAHRLCRPAATWCALEALGVHYEIHKVRYAGRGTD